MRWGYLRRIEAGRRIVKSWKRFRKLIARPDDSMTQFPGHQPGEKTDLVFGLDFGTSCTKAVIRSPFVMRSRAVAVRWSAGDGDSKYFLSTVLCENSRGELSIDETAGKCHADLKIRLMDESGDPDVRARAAAYLGYALRIARQWVLGAQKDAWGRFRLRWALNLGIPSAGYDDAEIRAAFETVARAAWRLSLQPSSLTLDAATDAIGDANKEVDSEIRVEVVPEIAAEVVGYAQSKWRRDGLHVMVDVGASTIDICGFVLHAPEDSDRYELLTALVKRLGVHELYLRRKRAIEKSGGRMRSDAPTALDPFGAIPEAGHNCIDAPMQSLRDELDTLDEQYAKECENAIMQVLGDLRKHRDPHSRAWSSGLPVFLAGGGSQFGLMKKSMRRVHERLTSGTNTKGIDERKLPMLDENVPAEISTRLGVACGLSFDKLDIGMIIRPSEIESVHPMPERPRREALSKDQV